MGHSQLREPLQLGSRVGATIVVYEHLLYFLSTCATLFSSLSSIRRCMRYKEVARHCFQGILACVLDDLGHLPIFRTMKPKWVMRKVDIPRGEYRRGNRPSVLAGPVTKCSSGTYVFDRSNLAPVSSLGFYIGGSITRTYLLGWASFGFDNLPLSDAGASPGPQHEKRRTTKQPH